MADNSYYYSKTTNSFYPKEFKKSYISANSWPADATPVSDEVFKTFSGNPPPCMVRGFDNDGMPTWCEKETPTDIENINVENFWVTSELARIRDEIEKLQDSDRSAFGTISEWRAYRKAVRAWNQNKDFPEKMCRPKSPDFKE